MVLSDWHDGADFAGEHRRERPSALMHALDWIQMILLENRLEAQAA